MKTAEEISSEIARTITSDPDSGVTFTGIKGSLRGYIDAVSFKIRDLWYDITQAKRDSMIDTCSGNALDRYISQRSELVRAGASKAGILLVLTGEVGIVIPTGTIVTNPTTKLRYVTMQDITIGDKGNSEFHFSYETYNRDYEETGLTTISLADIVWAECLVPGVIGRAPANSVTEIAVEGVTVSNPTPAQGGSDTEDDNTFRERYKNYIKVLNKGTDPFYQETVKYLNSDILRSSVKKDYTHPDQIKLTVVAKSGVPIPDVSLAHLGRQIQERNRSGEIAKCMNVNFTGIFIEYHVSLIGVNGQPTNLDRYFVDVADALAKYIDWSTWEWGKAVSLDNLFTICDQVPQTSDIPLETFKVNGHRGVSIPVSELPYFAGLTIINITNPSNVVVKSSTDIVQNFINLQLPPAVV